jgi:peptidoglycan/xylan/chitin deacetylase (PgdA/CDA1 family)
VHRIALTFDDGPDEVYTPRILDLLAKEHVQAAFFVLGMKLESRAGLALVRRAANEGHLIGNHSFSHPMLTRLSAQEIRSELLRTHDLISEFEPKQRLFRPPYGCYNETVKAVAKELKYKTVLWNVNAGDWKEENESSLWVDVAIEQITRQHLSICLLHDLRQTADHLPQLIERVKRLRRSQFVRYDRRRNLESLVRSSWVRSTGAVRNWRQARRTKRLD